MQDDSEARRPRRLHRSPTGDDVDLSEADPQDEAMMQQGLASLKAEQEAQFQRQEAREEAAFSAIRHEDRRALRAPAQSGADAAVRPLRARDPPRRPRPRRRPRRVPHAPHARRVVAGRRAAPVAEAARPPGGDPRLGRRAVLPRAAPRCAGARKTREPFDHVVIGAAREAAHARRLVGETAEDDHRQLRVDPRGEAVGAAHLIEQVETARAFAQQDVEEQQIWLSHLDRPQSFGGAVGTATR